MGDLDQAEKVEDGPFIPVATKITHIQENLENEESKDAVS